ncbi:MAG: hypothetical protein DCC71_06025 [Proteobacteria bacterium]|nr:MAG: hypothetical protein DCC71_06025 [Pseudomonadota bacterium]
MRFGNLRSVLTIAVLALATTAPASARALGWVVQPDTQLSIAVTTTTVFGTSAAQQALLSIGGASSGAVNEPVSGSPVQLGFGGGSGWTLADAQVDPLDPVLGPISMFLRSVQARLTGGVDFHPLQWDGYNASQSGIDLAGVSLTLDQGWVESYFPGAGIYFFDADPLVFNLTGQLADYSASERIHVYYDDDDVPYYWPTGIYDLWLGIDLAGLPPASFTLDSSLGPVTVTMELSGSLSLYALVPEPGTAGLVTLGLASLAARRRSTAG